MKPIKNVTPPFPGYDNYPRDDEGKILLDRADDGRIVIKRRNTIVFGDTGLIALCDGAKISRRDWVDLRRGFYMEEDDGSREYYYCIGGSDAGAIAGLSSYSYVLKIYKAKKSMEAEELPPDKEYLFAYGHVNEELVAQGFALKTGLEVFKNDAVFFNEKLGFAQANIDYFIMHKPGVVSILEIKTTAKDSTTDQLAKNGKVPPTYEAQARLHYPLTIGSAFNIQNIYFAVSSGNTLDDIHKCLYSRDPDGEAELLNIEKEFVKRLKNNDPPRDTRNPQQRLEDSGLKHVESQHIAVELDDNMYSFIEEFVSNKQTIKEIKEEQIKPIEKRNEELQAIICSALGEAECSTPVPVNGKPYVVKWASYEKKFFDKDKALGYPEFYKSCVTTKTERKFSIAEKKEKKSNKKEVK